MSARGKTAGFLLAFMLASAAGSAIAAPRSDDALAVDKMRAAIAANAEKALAKQGGSKILFKVDAAASREAVVTELRDDVYRTVREGRIPFSGLAIREGGVEIRIADAKDRQRVLGKLVPSTAAQTISVTDSGDGLIRLTPTEASLAASLHELVTQSSEMIDQRLRNSGIRDASEQPDGADRIRVLLPGVPQSKQPIASFRFNGRGTRRFAAITQENVGRPFAIVFDDQVLSSSIIREPIVGGSGQISGIVGIEDANNVAMLLRSGALPGRLSVVDQQVVEPAANATKQ
jgi:preprotein translocase subunit SecD